MTLMLRKISIWKMMRMIRNNKNYQPNKKPLLPSLPLKTPKFRPRNPPNLKSPPSKQQLNKRLQCRQVSQQTKRLQ
jgi:hypothetical protein